MEIVPFAGTQRELGSAARNVSGLLVRRGYRIDTNVLGEARSLRMIQRAGANVANIDLEAARASGVTVAAWPMHIDVSVAEHALLMMLGLARRVVDGDHAVRTGAYRTLGLEPIDTDEQRIVTNWMAYQSIPTLYGRTLGVIGLGEIGRLLAARAVSLGMHVLYHQRQPAKGDLESQLELKYASVDELLAESDFVSIHVPLTGETRDLVDDEFLRKMRQSAFLVNVSRGPVVDENALARALASGAIAGAGLDVYGREPLPHDSPLLSAPNLLLSPHLASGTDSHKDVVGLVGNLTKGLRGQAILHEIE